MVKFKLRILNYKNFNISIITNLEDLCFNIYIYMYTALYIYFLRKGDPCSPSSQNRHLRRHQVPPQPPGVEKKNIYIYNIK